ncbi:hypothetical protein ONS95_008949 [Cadophora gregata]|uniref:uncharacterized protein n=1 Tax=Cadophora gregata TaxID=51156 RepID=UPI0026DAABD8|nr:uncharacterized protein ONS95_008949 [Cadophora gregata]KAK0123961.1 hypothetical protein ONS95_008949 [Cadophora gregata]KAK0130300.1 hypothetical protein ONS96_000821 [Cadophora gregata f. sp. sojae]
MEPFDRFELSELDQIMPRVYVRWLLCIPISQTSPSKPEIVENLTVAIKETLTRLPILQGILVPKALDPSRLEVHVPKERPDFDLRVQHHTDDTDDTLPTHESLKEAEFPTSSLPDAILTPPEKSPPPVFDMMATFIRGGLLLCIKCHHAVVDGGGMGLVIKFLAQNCFAVFGNESRATINPPSIDRSILPPGKRSDLTVENGFRIVDHEGTAQKTNEYEPMTSHTFKFKPEALQRLKLLCTAETEFISTQDALTALLYGSVSYARGLRLTKHSTKSASLPSVMGIAVDGRGKLHPPLVNYAGNLTIYATYSSPILLPVQAIPRNSFENFEFLSQRLRLPSLAWQTRKAITGVTQDYVESVISVAKSLEDISRLQPTFANFYQGTDFFITSGADFPVFEQEWWQGGKIEAMRIPFKGHWDGSCAVLATENRKKGLDVMLGLREDDMAVVQDILLAFGAQIV